MNIDKNGLNNGAAHSVLRDAMERVGETPGFLVNEPEQGVTTASALLYKARKHMEDRAATYDQPQGERSMGKTVAAFNAITGRDLSESEGWALLALLKLVRDRAGKPHVDSVEDAIAYAALYGEARLAEVKS
jgi:hypothetical protein